MTEQDQIFFLLLKLVKNIYKNSLIFCFSSIFCLDTKNLALSSDGSPLPPPILIFFGNDE